MGSKSSSSQSSSQQDNRVGAEGEALAIGSGANVTIDNSSAFDQNVSEAFQSLVDFGGNALDAVTESVKTTAKQAEATTAALAQTRQLQETGTTAEAINPQPLILGGLGLGVLYLILSKAK